MSIFGIIKPFLKNYNNQMARILILFAHPSLEKSKINRSLLKHIPNNENIHIQDLYELYPDFNIDIEAEKKLLLNHDIIVWHHPFYWYSCPPLLKQWIDLVLEFGWAYGPGGTALKNKIIFNAISTGGTREVYSHEGRNRFTVPEFLAPFNQTAKLCNMIYLPPFAIQGTHKLSEEDLQKSCEDYQSILLKMLQVNFKYEEVLQYTFLNDWINQSAKQKI